MSDELKCPVCGEELYVCQPSYCIDRYAVEHECTRMTVTGYYSMRIVCDAYKTKRSAIKAAKRLLAKMRG